MPKRTDIHNILIIGSGPIRIGQACEFDYSGSQACKVLKKEGFRVVLVNSNLATIMTDPEMADAIYLESITLESIEKILKKEKIDTILPTIGGQTSLNMAVELEKSGLMKKYGIKFIGTDVETIERAEDREKFKQAMKELNYKVAFSHHVTSLEQANEAMRTMSFPMVIRPSFTLGGTGGSIVENKDSFEKLVKKGLTLAMGHGVILEQSLLGWNEYELEVVKDAVGNVIIICSIENLDPMGIHTGDSITVAPQQTLNDREYQNLRDMSINIIKKIGVNAGGANIQYAVHPQTREVIVIEMNPRVSRSSALASKATGFPIAKVAVKLAVGYSLDELKNDITTTTPACFEPTIDYVVTKIPRFAFEKFLQSPPHLGIQMQSVGETMAIGRTFCQSLQKAIRGLEIKKLGFEGDIFSYKTIGNLSQAALEQWIKKEEPRKKEAEEKVKKNHYLRLFSIKDLFYFGYDIEKVHQLSSIDYWFLQNLKSIYDLEKKYFGKPLESLDKLDLLRLKKEGFSDEQINKITIPSENQKRLTNPTDTMRSQQKLAPKFKAIDTCAGEFAVQTPYFYSSYDEEDELEEFIKKWQSKPNKGIVVILGSGPNRIGQGIEFDYMCTKACLALKKLGYITVMINCNPETVSTDYDISDLLFFEPLFPEETLEILKRLDPLGVMIHFGGQTPLNLAKTLTEKNIPILGTSSQSIFTAEDRESFKSILEELNYNQPSSRVAFTLEQGKKALKELGLPLMVRPSFILGGRAIEIVVDEDEFEQCFLKAQAIAEDNAILIDVYLKDAIEFDVDLICDGKNAIVAGVLEHIEQAGVHSGDSACLLPQKNISQEMLKKIIHQTKTIAVKLKTQGFLNVQIAVKDGEIFFLEANPRGSRTIPFLCKAMVQDWVALATRIMLGQEFKPEDFALDYEKRVFQLQFVKEAFLSFDKFPNEDSILGPEMKSTGEVIGVGKNIAEAFHKAQISVGVKLPAPNEGNILISCYEKTQKLITLCETLTQAGYSIYATEGTHQYLQQGGIKTTLVGKVYQEKPNLADKIVNGEIKLIFNTPLGKEAVQNDAYIRILARQHQIGIITTIPAMNICAQALLEKKKRDFDVYSINEDYSKKD